ncbi:MAG: ornithine cyclodeaminase family protein [Hyphomicrobiales bacterium]
MSLIIVGFDECDALLNWHDLCAAIEDWHRLPPANIQDVFLYRGADTLLSRCAWIDGLGMAVKMATVFPGNKARGETTTNGAVMLYSDRDGTLQAMIDFHLATKWKTAADSLLAAKKLARSDSANILIVGAGAVARSMRQAYASVFPGAQFSVWSRTEKSAQSLAADYPGTAVQSDLEAAVRASDIVSCATMSTAPLIRGSWLQPGQHIDLIGAYRPDMREADDEALKRARIFVDSRETTLEHIGELKTPLETGVISNDAVVADFYDMSAGTFCRKSSDEITLFKNGGGAHLDLMCCRYILDVWRN